MTRWKGTGKMSFGREIYIHLHNHNSETGIHTLQSGVHGAISLT